MCIEDFLCIEVELLFFNVDEVWIKVEYLSFDFFFKGQMENIGYVDVIVLGEVMCVSGVGEVVESNYVLVFVGVKVMGFFGWQDYVMFFGDDVEVIENYDLFMVYLGFLGGIGLIVYFGFFNNGKLKEGEMVVVIGVVGVVGFMVG